MPHAANFAPPSAVKIVAIENAGSARDHVVMRLEDGAEHRLPRELLARAGLRAGETIDAEGLRALLREDLQWGAREAALRLLAHRPRTESELRRRLLGKGFPEEIVEGTVRVLREKALLDDADFAEMFARDRVRLNPRGRRLVVQELRGRGVEADVASRAVEAVMREEEVDEVALAREAARRWRRRSGEELERARRRLTGHLARRGFGAGAVRTVVSELLGEE